jgi:hypothetical protein
MAAQRVRYTGHIAVHYRIPVRRFNPEQAQRRLQAIVDSSVVNAEALARMADSLAHDAELQGMLSDHLVDGALSVFHKLPKMPDRHAAATTLQRLRESGFIGLLWRHARSAAQRRRTGTALAAVLVCRSREMNVCRNADRLVLASLAGRGGFRLPDSAHHRAAQFAAADRLARAAGNLARRAED